MSIYWLLMALLFAGSAGLQAWKLHGMNGVVVVTHFAAFVVFYSLAILNRRRGQ